MRASAWSDPVFRWLCKICAMLCGLLMVAFFVQLAFASGEAWSEFGLGFFVSTEWDPVRDLYGALPSIAGTVFRRNDNDVEVALLQHALVFSLAFADGECA